ncbi:hypothetical protein BC833DRAFT_537860 [Globomyces pollinis-pini]|nr:hypothetical protein BC833DRAFT_537860 [Globomyces pollinis-pini]
MSVSKTKNIISFMGEVIGTKMNKTCKVRVEKIKMHPLVQKPVRYHKNYLVHDENEQCVVGDYVRIDSCQKISKLKFFTLGEISRPAQQFVDSDGILHTQGKTRKELKRPVPQYNLNNFK